MKPDVAEEIGAALKRRCEIAGVFVNSTLEDLIEAAEDETLTLIQFHGDEGPAFRAEVRPRTGAKVIKAWVSKPRRRPGGRGVSHRLPPPRCLLPWDLGGTGESFDWGFAVRRRSRCR